MKRLISIGVLLVAGLALFPACTSIPEEFNQDQELWQRHNIKDYAYTINLQYFARKYIRLLLQ